MLDSITPPSSRVPFDRLATILIADMQCRAVAAGIEALEDLDRAILFAVVVRRSGALPSLSGHARGDERPQAITVNALAASLARPFETVRRHVNAMIDAGLFERLPRGIRVPPQVLEWPAIAAMLAADHDALVKLIDDMAAFGMPLPAPRPSAIGYDSRHGTAAALDVLLGGIEFGAPHYDNWLEMVMATAVVRANGRPVIDGRSTGPAARPTAEKIRAPVKIVAVARALGLPYSTMRRHVDSMLRCGILERKRRGLVAAESWLARPALIEDTRTVIDHTRQIFARLAAAGFPFDAPASAYLTRQPVPEKDRRVIAMTYAAE